MHFGATARGLCSSARRIGDARHSIDIEDFWRVHNIGRSYGFFGGYRTPPGTLWADAIRLMNVFRRSGRTLMTNDIFSRADAVGKKLLAALFDFAEEGIIVIRIMVG